MSASLVFAIIGVLLGITTMIGILGNFCVFLVVFWSGSKKNQVNILLVNLAISDIGMCISCMPFAVATVFFNIQQSGEAFCLFSGMLVTLFAVASGLIMCVISVYQYACVVKARGRIFTNLRCLFIVLCAWLIALFLALGPAIKWGRYEVTSHIFNCEYFHVSFGAMTSYNVTLIICSYAFPVGALMFSYTALKCHTLRLSKPSPTNDPTTLSVSCMSVFVVVFVFIVCRTPLCLYLIFVTKFPNQSFDVLGQLSFWAIYLHSACNPFIYAFKQSDYRNTLAEIHGKLRHALRYPRSNIQKTRDPR